MALDKTHGTPRKTKKSEDLATDIGGMYQALINSLSNNNISTISFDFAAELNKGSDKSSVTSLSIKDDCDADELTSTEGNSPERGRGLGNSGKSSPTDSQLHRFSVLMSSPIKKKQMGLVAQVLGIVKTQTEESIRTYSEKKTQADMQELEHQRLQEHLLTLGDWMDKRSPKNILLWQVSKVL